MVFADLLGIILCFGAGFLCSLIVCSGFNGDRKHIIAIIISTLILGGFFLYQLGGKDETKTTYTSIVSLERGSEVSGDFVLGFGYVETQIKYYAYHERQRDEFILISRGNQTIKENNNRVPGFYKETKCTKPGLLWRCKLDRYIVVPKGTIKKQFSIN